MRHVFFDLRPIQTAWCRSDLIGMMFTHGLLARGAITRRFDEKYRGIGIPSLYPLVMTNSSPWYRWPIEIDGLPIKNGDFPWLC